MAAGSRPARRRLPLRRRILFALAPLVALLLLAELVIRIGRAPLHFGSFRELRTSLLKRNYPARLDDLLGYAPLPGFRSRDNHWGTMVSIDEEGIRENGDAPAPDGPLVVAVGDSFTFGDQVDDDASWPALLERRLGRPVKNGGVFGYSFVQIVLRGEDLLRRFRPATLVASFIPDDLARCAYSRRYTPVPWFDLVDGRIELRGVPIDHTPRPDDPDTAWKNLLGHSALLDVLFASADRAWWFEEEKQVPVHHLHGRTAELGALLVERLAATCRRHDTLLVLLLQGERPTGPALSVLERARDVGVPMLDLASRYVERVQAEPALADRWFDGHMTPAGNAWVAEELAALLRSLR